MTFLIEPTPDHLALVTVKVAGVEVYRTTIDPSRGDAWAREVGEVFRAIAQQGILAAWEGGRQ